MSFTWFLLIVIIIICIVLQQPNCSVVSLRSSQYSTESSILNECGVRPARRQPRFYNINRSEQQQHPHPYQQQQQHNSRKAKIIAGSRTKEGQFPWQASLELLHPSLGFLGHWCGGVLIDPNWVLSAAHCIHNDLFNLPLPPLWTVVLGEHDRSVESGYEQRIPVEKIVLHKTYENFLHDLVLMKLSIPANISNESNIRKICLPFIFDEMQQSVDDGTTSSSSSGFVLDPISTHDLDSLDKAENYLRSTRYRNNGGNVTSYPSMKELLSTKIMNRLEGRRRRRQSRSTRNRNRMRRRNDKFMRGFSREDNEDDEEVTMKDDRWVGSYNRRRVNDDGGKSSSIDDYKDLPYIDCLATGWGKSNKTGDLTEILLKTNVPLHNNIRCHDAYGSFVRIHKGHLCAGKLNGKGGTCVGDSGGPLQCRLTKDGPWILAGITSFGSGCAMEGFPDVYTRTSFYMKWIIETIKSE
ncbi:hypothetical protein ACFFRR_006964 [Megaselia abdita]